MTTHGKLERILDTSANVKKAGKIQGKILKNWKIAENSGKFSGKLDEKFLNTYQKL